MSVADDLTSETTRARPPVSVPAVTRVAIALALTLTAAGGVLVRDALVAADLMSGTPWSTTALRTVDGLRPATWMVPAGLALALLGVAWILLALSPRRRTELTLDPAGLAFLRPIDLARIARTTAEDVDGVLTARTSATRRRVRVTVQVIGDSTGIRSSVEAAVRQALAPVHPTPSLTVSARTAGGSS